MAENLPLPPMFSPQKIGGGDGDGGNFNCHNAKKKIQGRVAKYDRSHSLLQDSTGVHKTQVLSRYTFN